MARLLLISSPETEYERFPEDVISREWPVFDSRKDNEQ